MLQILLAEVQLVAGLASVCVYDCEYATAVDTFTVPVAWSNFNGNCLAVIRLKPAVLICACTVELKFGRAVNNVDVGIVLSIDYFYCCGYNVNLSTMILSCTKVVDVFDILVGNEAFGGIFMMSVIVCENLAIVKICLAKITESVLETNCSCASEDYLVTKLNLCKLVVSHIYRDNSCLVDEVEAFLVNEGGTYNTFECDFFANLCRDSIANRD